MQYPQSRSFLCLLFCLYGGIASCTRNTPHKEPLVVKKEIKKDIITCRYPERMTSIDRDTALPAVKTSAKKE